ncbi:putative L-type lectin-domain containing receptor kinase S.5 [Dorcoceras hygrometricum]|uniref:Putative L-type lectin-domain containing receptor kinase S.5 n=1 Tax=Dorcoceras hygrometricum TaxID=472368 RepID=A0A2Z7BNT3_9LAMI|nr:putative L-type lectin-domain containing receptor kinase S.5 [Dorcoceras hygrometricum]
MRTTTPKAKRLEKVTLRSEVLIRPAVKRKCTTIGRAAVRPTVPIQMTHPPKCKLILLEDSDSEDPKPLLKEIKVSAPVDQNALTSSRLKAKIFAVPDNESLSLRILYGLVEQNPFLLRRCQDSR